MSLKNEYLVMLHFALYSIGITGAIGDYTANEAYGLADVAHTRRLESAVRSSYPEWYGDGMKHSAYTINRYKWKKRIITWALVKEPTLGTESVVKICEKSFGTWSAAIPKDFKQVSPDEQPDIKISFESDFREWWRLGKIRYPSREGWMDKEGAGFAINDMINWVDDSLADYKSLPHVILHEIGHVLGLGHSVDREAVMFDEQPRGSATFTYRLHSDDVTGIQQMYGARTADKIETQPDHS